MERGTRGRIGGESDRWSSPVSVRPQAASDHQDSPEIRTARLCASLSPPPVPPWLETDPFRFHQLVSSCPSWHKYSELCPDHVARLFPSARKLQDPLHSKVSQETASTRLLPFVAAVTVGLGMLLIMILTYLWHQRKRQTSPYTARFTSRATTPFDSSPLEFYQTPSVTVETRLSVSAANIKNNSPDQAYSIYREGVWPAAFDMSMTSWPAPDSSPFHSPSLRPTTPISSEVLLQPDQLEEGRSDTFYTTQTSVCEEGFYSTHSLPVDYGKAKHEQAEETRSASKSRKARRRSFSSKQGLNFLRSRLSTNYFHFKRPGEDTALLIHQPSRVTGVVDMDGHKSVVKRCRDAGHRVLDKLPWKTGRFKLPKLPRPAHRPLRAFRQPLVSAPSLSPT